MKITYTTPWDVTNTLKVGEHEHVRLQERLLGLGAERGMERLAEQDSRITNIHHLTHGPANKE